MVKIGVPTKDKRFCGVVLFFDEAYASVFCGHLYKVFQASFKHFLPVPFSALDISNADALIAFREVLKVLPRISVGLERFKYLSRDNESSLRTEGVGYCRKSGVGHSFLNYQLADSFPVSLRKIASWFPRGESLSEAFIVNAFDGAVNPAKTERLVHSVVV